MVEFLVVVYVWVVGGLLELVGLEVVQVVGEVVGKVVGEVAGEIVVSQSCAFQMGVEHVWC